MFAWFLLFAGAWWILAEGQPGGWAVGLAAAAAAVAVRRRLGAPPLRPWRPGGVLRFVPYFLWQSLRGGADVGLRAIRPGLPIAPDLVPYRMRLPEGPARDLFVGAMSLLPGTFSADVDGDTLSVHVLDRDDDLPASLRQLERRVAAVFGLTLDGGGRG